MPTGSTSASVTNEALQFIGSQEQIASLADGSPAANAAAAIYTPTVTLLLREIDPEFARYTTALTLSDAPTPIPPWAYEYQYPVDCLRAVQIIPANQTGFGGSTPITTAVTGGASAFWWGAPVKYKVQTDEFYPVTAAAIVNGGTGHVVGDILTLAPGLTTNPPIGAPVQLLVTGALGGVISTVSIVNVISGSSPSIGSRP